MKKLIIIFLAISALCINSFADPMYPADIIRTAIKSAQNDQLEIFLNFVDVVSIHNQKQQPRSPEEIVELLKSINIKNLQFDESEINIKEGETTLVTLDFPLKIEFIVLCTGLPDGEPRFKIIGIYKK